MASTASAARAEGLPEVVLGGLEITTGYRDHPALAIQAAAQKRVAQPAYRRFEVVQEPVREIELVLSYEDVDEVEQDLQSSVPVAHVALDLEAANELLPRGGVIAVDHVLHAEVLKRCALEVSVIKRPAELAHPLELVSRRRAACAV